MQYSNYNYNPYWNGNSTAWPSATPAPAPSPMVSAPRYDITYVNGENGANSFQMGPNSKVLLLDEHNPIVWFVQSDGAGYKTVTPYTISKYEPAPAPDFNSLEARIAQLEEKINAKSNSGSNKGKRNNGNAANTAEPQGNVQSDA